MSVRVLIGLLLAGVLVGALVELSCLAGEMRNVSAMPQDVSGPPGVDVGSPSAPELEPDDGPAAGPIITY
jgi:hypothetical protein